LKIETLAKSGCHAELATREINKRRRIYSSKVKLVCTSVLLFPTAGATAFGLVLALRQRSVAKKKYEAITSAMNRYNMRLPTPRKRDKAIPLVVNIAVYSLTLGLLWGFEELGLFAANGMSEVGITLSSDLVGTSHIDQAMQMISDPSAFAHGVTHGAEAQVGDVHAAISPHETVLNESIKMAQPISTTTTQYLSGGTAGYAVMPVVEKFALVNVASGAMERMARAETDFFVKRKPVVEKGEFLVKRKPVVEKGDLMTVSENEIVEIVGA
jgi:hypothetical protein